MIFSILLFLITGSVCFAQDLAIDLPSEIRGWYKNPDGSCVQCSIGMVGTDQNVKQAQTLLWKTNYGPAERGGSGPSRVAAYCKSRGIKAYNITGDSTFKWMAWAIEEGKGAAIGAGTNHFQTLVGYDHQKKVWLVCNNNSTGRIDEYTDSEFRRLHLSSGRWVVILDYPPHPPIAQYIKWW